MVLILLSVIFTALAVAISMVRNSFGVLAAPGIAREDIAVEKERSEQPTIASSTKQVLVVLLPDGKIVDPKVPDRF